MLLSLSNDQLFLFPSAKPNSLFKPTPSLSFFIFPSQSSKFPKFQSRHLRFRPTLALASEADTRTLPRSAIQRIAEKLRSLGYVEEEKVKDSSNDNNGPSPGQIFVPLPTQLPKYRVGHTLDPSWSTPENPVPEPGSGNAIQRYHKLRRVVIKEKIQERSKKKENVPTLAELTLSQAELKRLRTAGIGLKKKLKVGKAGITEGIVNGIHERWRQSELVKITCEDICRMNMKRTHELLERKTGGLVIWRSGSNIILYRGVDYKYPYFLSEKPSRNDSTKEYSLNGGAVASTSEVISESSNNKTSHPPLIQGVGSPNRVRFQLPGEAQLAEEADRLLEGLGPRFTDWWGYEPLPVDADLLPAVVPGFRRPFRLLPYGVKPQLTNDEMTILKRLGRPLPCHFALGRNRKLKGLAASIIKLWEKCEIAKVAIKRGVQNTSSELMAEELKFLTGGVLLSRDKEFIVLYRGKDFLPAAVSSAIEERRKHEIDDKGKGTNKNFSRTVVCEDEQQTSEDACGDETNCRNDEKFELSSEERKLKSTETAIERTHAKLSEALAKKVEAENILAKLENDEISRQLDMDKEDITEDEKYMLRKIGLKMKPFLLMGRRGVFAGTIENMHLHWKYRELVKIVTGARSIEEVNAVARSLEAESGGILVSIERVSKGYAIIVYRGKNYTRPSSLRPHSLLNKRQAMKRSIEAQRRESLKLHVLKLTRKIDNLKLQLGRHEDKDSRELTNESKLEPGEEQEMNKIQSVECRMSVDTPESCVQSFSGSQSDEKVSENWGANSTSTILNDAAPRNFLDFASEDPLGDIKVYESDPLPEPVVKDTEKNSLTNGTDESSVTSSSDSLDTYRHTGFSVSSVAEPRHHDIKTPDSQDTGSELSVHSVKENGYKLISSGVTRLSNKERLLLRKQALKMKKHPLFSIGKSNRVDGVAKAIKTHFQRHPLAIVNVKGRAKGTSVLEVVVKLEEATGAVLVSQEPSKVILYRGWGADEEPDHIKGKGKINRSCSDGREKNEIPHVISRELISAIRLECGLR